jgi:hypothetical protein
VPTSRRRKPPPQRRSRAEREEDRRSRLIRNAHKLPVDPMKLAPIVERNPREFQALLTRRWADYRQRCMRERALLPQRAWNTIAAIPIVDTALTGLGSGWPEQPDLHTRESWPEHLRWAADGVANVARLCRFGQVYGAIVLARTQLERWTANVAHHHSIDQQPDESTSAWIARAWGVYSADHASAAQRSWELLSEWLHGRGVMATACSTAWTEQPAGTSSELPPELVTVLDQIWEATDLAFRQARGGTWLVANTPETAHILDPDDPRLRNLEMPDQPGVYAILQSEWHLPAYQERDDFARTLVPVDMIVPYTPFAETLVAAARGYRRYVGSARAQADAQNSANPRLGEDAVRERRARAIETARKAFDIERAALGDDFSPKQLGAKLFRFAAIAHAARMTAEWSAGAERAALLVAASALDSGWILWLEDTDQAMTCVRGIAEQTARARCWRVKTTAAAKLEAAHSPPSRWIEKAGWRRLSVLIRALGEFAHTTHRSEWGHARDTLIALNTGPHDPLATARGSILNAAAYMLADEVVERLMDKDPRLVEGFRAAVTLLDREDHAAMLEALLERGLATKLAQSAAVANDVGPTL